MANYTITGKLEEVNGLVDYIAAGYIERDGEKIPCQVGFINAVTEPVATHIFIKDGITENGVHYYAETIEI